MQQNRAFMERHGFTGVRLLVDVVADFYTLVMEMPVESLDAMGTDQIPASARDEWQRLYSAFTPLVRKGRREVFRVIE